MAKQKKFYVVWKGRKIGIYDNWDTCKAQIHEFEGAQYKSFANKQLAENAFIKEYEEVILFKQDVKSPKLFTGEIIADSICVDGAWNTATLDCEYRGVVTSTGKKLFKKGPFKDGTNNIVEFLAIVHALAYCKKEDLQCPIYSDSRNAIGWVYDKKARTNLKETINNKPIFELIDRAEKWLASNNYINKILKWETKDWGENPADFGRK